MMRQRMEGLTLVELLASITILGIIMVVILSPLSAVFRGSQQTVKTLDQTTQAQNVMEFIKGQWRTYPSSAVNNSNAASNNESAIAQSKNRYNKTCFDPTNLVIGSDFSYTVTAVALTADGSPDKSLTMSKNCTSATADTTSVPIKRITVKVTDSKGKAVSLATDIARP